MRLNLRARLLKRGLERDAFSQHTQERNKGYFRLEGKLAVEQTHLMAEGVPFLAPVVVDDTTESDAVGYHQLMPWQRAVLA